MDSIHCRAISDGSGLEGTNRLNCANRIAASCATFLSRLEIESSGLPH